MARWPTVPVPTTTTQTAVRPRFARDLYDWNAQLFGYPAPHMLTIVQTCPAPGCSGEVRYVHARRSAAALKGSCEGCGRTYRLVSGRPAEIGRRMPGKQAQRAGNGAA
jgi:hypothetical protein